LEQVFVSREKELARLGEFLDRTLGGRGQVCFVTGEAGFGKTSLTVEFTRRAQQQNAELLVAVGACDAQTGISDPYLPFRELLGMLTGQFDERVAHGLTTVENTRRLHDFLRVSKSVIAELAPDLVDIFIPGAGLVTKAGKLVAGDRGRSKVRAASMGLGATAPSSADAAPMAEQGRIFEQITSVLVEMAKKRPLVLIFDDLHWIDESSGGLLFHLARRIEASRILILCTYRPEDDAFGRTEWRHPLPKMVSELKRQYGDMFVTLGDETPDEARGFIDALIDSEPNRLDDAFRRQLQQRTRGHALFVTELLRDMQERGDLAKDEAGRWVTGRSLDWAALPKKIEGVIEERIARISSDVQELLTIASVEGETFTVQVISRLKQLDERQLLRTLTQELDRQHRLVSEAGIERFGTTRISQFRFRHQMFQRYFYGTLGESERELLHEDVAGVLEVLYAGRTDKVAVQLAHHYDLARRDDRAAAAFLQAGRGALAIYAHREALALARRGLDCLARSGEDHRQVELHLDLHLLIAEALRHDGRFAESMENFREAAELAVRFGSPEALAQAALGYDEPRWRCNLVEPFANELLAQALERIGSADGALRVYLLAHLARGSQDSVRPEEQLAMLDEAVAMARRIDDPRALVEALRLRVTLDRNPDNIERRIALIDEMLLVGQRIGDKHLLMELLMFRVYDLVALGDAANWGRDLDTQQSMADEVGEPFYSYNVRAMKVARAVNAGRFDEAERLATEAHAIGQQLGVNNVEGVLGVQMFTIRREQGRLREIAPLVKHFVEERGASATWRPGLALIYADLDLRQDARSEFERLAADGFGSIPRDSLWQTSLCYLAEVCGYLEDAERAAVLYELLLPYARLTVILGNATVCYGATSRFLGQLASIRAQWDAAEAHFEHALDLNGRMGAIPWLAHTRVQYSRQLLRRGRREDVERAGHLLDEAVAVARQHGMHGLQSRVSSGSAVH
jgi:tetratricopeptide (TPR) repeat protein